jgi:serine/threonine protein kinase
MHPLTRKLCKPVPGKKFRVGGVDYVLHGKIGDGAAGLVRKAERSHDGSKLAVKFLAPDPKYIDEAVFDDVAARFRREGERSQRLIHENLVRIHAYEENTGGNAFLSTGPKNPFILMERVEGTTLEDYIRRDERRRLDKNQRRAFELTPERLAIAVYVTEALRYLHQRALVHRDVKPANIFIPDTSPSRQRRAKLGDFGIVKWGDFQASVSSGTLTMTSQRGLGTLKYMSPEQALTPKDVTVRSDIFSLGITLFELFTGQVLPSPHHVFEIQNARLLRGNTASRIMALAYQIADSDIGIAELVLDMYLRGPSGRPAIDKIAGRLKFAWESQTREDW